MTDTFIDVDTASLHSDDETTAPQDPGDAAIRRQQVSSMDSAIDALYAELEAERTVGGESEVARTPNVPLTPVDVPSFTPEPTQDEVSALGRAVLASLQAYDNSDEELEEYEEDEEQEEDPEDEDGRSDDDDPSATPSSPGKRLREPKVEAAKRNRGSAIPWHFKRTVVAQVALLLAVPPDYDPPELLSALNRLVL